MSQLLEADEDFEKVRCPSCHHEWYTKKAFGYGHKETIYCPSCRKPLKAPSGLEWPFSKEEKTQ